MTEPLQIDANLEVAFRKFCPVCQAQVTPIQTSTEEIVCSVCTHSFEQPL